MLGSCRPTRVRTCRRQSGSILEIQLGTGKARRVERFTRTGPDSLLYEFTVTDPAAFAAPWSVALPMTRSDEPVFEYACHEGNEAMLGILRGARFGEKNAKP